ncbi:MAG TPA: hypothetical protein VH025_07845 [Solirubrobacteraceae bacterium]|jgi:hypothetical protein|nr:hypothetical protein [Solirubrobacteraceae bacterium]
MEQREQLTITQTRTGYWTVQRGRVHVAGASTRKGAEAERDLRNRLRGRTIRRATRSNRADAPSAA